MGRSLKPNYWSEVLKARGLESPGREEAVRDAIEISKRKKEKQKESKKK